VRLGRGIEVTAGADMPVVVGCVLENRIMRVALDPKLWVADTP
jgi:hypothetical protein